MQEQIDPVSREAVIGEWVKRLYFPASEADISKRVKQFAEQSPGNGVLPEEPVREKRWQMSQIGLDKMDFMCVYIYGKTEFPTLSRRNAELPTGGKSGRVVYKLLEVRTNLLRKRGWVEES